MPSITIPLWMLLSVAALPALALIVLGIRLMRAKRHQKTFEATMAPPELIAAPTSAFDERIHRQLLDQQIDAVFDVLMTLIDTERCKLKTLVNHALPILASTSESQAPIVTQTEQTAVAPRRDAPAPEITTIALSQNISNLAQEGMSATDIAQRLGLSFNEVALALKMQAGRNTHIGRRVMAVA